MHEEIEKARKAQQNHEQKHDVQMEIPERKASRFGVDHTRDEFGSDVYFVVNLETGDWIGDAHPTKELAWDAVAAYAELDDVGEGE